jgi:uncharacterized tellurite resistance protein B-like protein
MNRTQSIALVRALAAVSWADGRLERSEESHLTSLAYRLGLSADDLRAEVRPLLEHPLSYDRAMEVVGELVKVLGSADDREFVLRELQSFFEADGLVSDEERTMLAEIERALADYGTLDFLVGKLRAALGLALGRSRRPGSPAERLRPPVKSKALGHLIERLHDAGLGGALSPTELNRAALEGALMARVATADDHQIDDAELARIRAVLESRELADEVIEVVLRVIREGTPMDRQRLCTEFNRVSTLEERKTLVQELFAVAGPNGGAGAQSEIRLIANFFWIPTREFVALRAQASPEG